MTVFFDAALRARAGLFTTDERFLDKRGTPGFFKKP